MLVKLNSEFFTKRRAPASFRLAKNFGEIDPWRAWVRRNEKKWNEEKESICFKCFVVVFQGGKKKDQTQNKN
jgi:hypothetical protein